MSRRFYTVMLTAFAALAVSISLFQGAQAQSDDEYAPNWTSYQGYLTDDNGDPYAGEADLYFALYDESNGGNKEWSEFHDDVDVNNGYFYVMLGGDDAPTGYWDYTDDNRYMEVRVCTAGNCSSDGEGNGWETMPRQQYGAVPYAMRAHRAYSATWASKVEWDHIQGVPAELGGGYKYYVTVAKEGGDYTTLYDAMQSINDAGPTKPYLIYVAPGYYEETQTITTKPYVHIKGAGKYATVIYNSQQNKTIILRDYVSIYDITFENRYQGGDSYAIYAHSGDYGNAKNVYLYYVRADANYNYSNNYQGYRHYGIYLYGDVEVHANYLYAYGRYAQYNYGGYITNGAQFYPSNSHFYGEYGYEAYGLRNQGNGSYLEAYYIKAYGKYARDYNYGLYNYDRAEAKLNKGYYKGQYGGDYNYGDYCYGIYNEDAYLEAHYVYGYGYECKLENYGLYNYYDNYETTAYVYYGYFKGYKGYVATGVYNYGYSGGNYANLHIYDSYGYGDDANYQGGNTGNGYGLWNSGGGHAYIDGGYYRAKNGYFCYGVNNNGNANSMMEVNGSEMYGQGCSETNYGFYNVGASAYTYYTTSWSDGGVNSYGYYCSDNGGMCKAAQSTSWAEGGSDKNRGYYINDGATGYCDNCTVKGTGNGAYGAYVDAQSAMYMGNSKLDNGSGNPGWGGTGANFTCYNSYQYDYNNACPAP